MQNLLICRNIYRLGSFDDPGHISGCHFLVFDCDHSTGIEAADVIPGDTGIHIANLAVGHELSFFKRPLNRVHGGLDIDHHSFAHSAGFMLAQAKHFKASLRQYFGNDSNYFAGADIEGDDQILDVTCHGVIVSFWVELVRVMQQASMQSLLGSADRRA